MYWRKRINGIEWRRRLKTDKKRKEYWDYYIPLPKLQNKLKKET